MYNVDFIIMLPSFSFTVLVKQIDCIALPQQRSTQGRLVLGQSQGCAVENLQFVPTTHALAVALVVENASMTAQCIQPILEGARVSLVVFAMTQPGSNLQPTSLWAGHYAT